MAHYVTLAEAAQIAEATQIAGSSRTHIYRQAARGRLTLVKRGGRTLVDIDELTALNSETRPVVSEQRTVWRDLRLERDTYRNGLERLTSFVRRVADYSSDDTLSREARDMAIEAQALVATT